MSIPIAATSPDQRWPSRLRLLRPRSGARHRHTIIPRLIAGAPLLGIGLIHVIDPELQMRPLVEAAGIPLAAVASPLGVSLEIAAGLSLLLGLWVRVGALLAIPTMLVAAYAHMAIDVWPNGAENEPPLALPLVVALCAAYVAWRGAGRWSLDARSGSDRRRNGDEPR